MGIIKGSKVGDDVIIMGNRFSPHKGYHFAIFVLCICFFVLALKRRMELINFQSVDETTVSQTMVSFHPHSEYPKEAELIMDVPYTSQLPELRNGCEVTSSTMLLNYYGFAADKCQMADDYLPKLYPYNAVDPEEGYMGDPYTLWGYYCMTKPIVVSINDYFSDLNVHNWKAVDISGVSVNQIKSYISEGTPIQVWVTKGFSMPEYNESFVLPNGEKPYSNLHSVVITGMSESEFYLNDPLIGKCSVSIELFQQSFTELGNRAVCIKNGE